MKAFATSITACLGLSMGLSIAILTTGNFAVAQTTVARSAIVSGKTPARKSTPASSITKAVNAQTKKGRSKTRELPLTLAAADDDNAVLDLKESTTQLYKCELNDSLTIYSHKVDNNRVALRWHNKLYGLKRVETTTGANRFENKKSGMVWIRIPSKGMLLDSIHGQQLTNECKTTS
ncbi:MAG: putative signal peptide protein [Solimicrobium sp.]|nr:putative signal peptide protein [Solimicrobium sp.]